MGFLANPFSKKQVPTDIDRINPEQSGCTKLHLACSGGDVEQVRKLLAQGANANILNVNGATALDLAYSNGADGRYRSVYAEIAKLVRAKGGTTNKWDGATF
jgi:ankyrin repeat protein